MGLTADVELWRYGFRAGMLMARMNSSYTAIDQEAGKDVYGYCFNVESDTQYDVNLTENESLMMTFYKVGDQLLFDPIRDEEDASSARLTLAISKPGKDKIINSMQKGGLDSISIEHLNQVIEEAEKVYDKIFPELDKKIEGLK